MATTLAGCRGGQVIQGFCEGRLLSFAFDVLSLEECWMKCEEDNNAGLPDTAAVTYIGDIDQCLCLEACDTVEELSTSVSCMF